MPILIYWWSTEGEPPNEYINGGTNLSGIPTDACLKSIMTLCTDVVRKHYGLSVLYFSHATDEIRCGNQSHISKESDNTQMLSAKDIKKIQDVVLQIEDQQRFLSKSGNL